MTELSYILIIISILMMLAGFIGIQLDERARAKRDG